MPDQIEQCAVQYVEPVDLVAAQRADALQQILSMHGIDDAAPQREAEPAIGAPMAVAREGGKRQEFAVLAAKAAIRPGQQDVLGKRRCAVTARCACRWLRSQLDERRIQRQPRRHDGSAGGCLRVSRDRQRRTRRCFVMILRLIGEGVLVDAAVSPGIGDVPIDAGVEVVGDLHCQQGEAARRIAAGPVDPEHEVVQLRRRRKNAGMFERPVSAGKARQRRIGHDRSGKSREFLAGAGEGLVRDTIHDP